MPEAKQSAAQRRLKEKYGPVALVTGASSGIGRAFARQLATAGFDLLLVARRSDVLTALAEELTARNAIGAAAFSVDLSDSRQIERLVDATARRDIGLLVASAGFGTSGPFIENDPDEELNMVDLNCRAVAQLTHVFARKFVAQKRGGIVLMSSILGFQGVPRAVTYAATKAFVQTLAEGLYDELRTSGVDVIASAPGPVATEFALRAALRYSVAQKPDEVAAGTLSALGRRATVRPGLLAKILEGPLKTLPRAGRVVVMKRIVAAMTPR